MRRIASGFALACMLVSLTSQATDAATTAYLAARDKAVAEFRAADLEDPKTDERMQASLQTLQGMMQSIVGPIRLQGFPPKGSYYVDTLTDEEGYGKLDGVAASSSDGKSFALITTVPLLRDWLGHSSDIPKPAAASVDSLATVFTSETFYTEAFSDDAHYYKYAELPVSQGASGVARAILFTSAQDDPAPSPPDGILVALVNGERVVLLRKSWTTPDIPECAAAYRETSKKVDAALSAYHSSKLADKAKFDQYVDLGEKANGDFLQCYAQHLPGVAAYASLVREAQGMVDLVK